MKRIAFCTLGLAALFTTACQDHENLYDANYANEKKQLKYNTSFADVFGTIDPNQDWNLFTTANVQVTVNEDWGETYTVKVYTANPLDETSGAMLLASGEVKSGETFAQEITVPKSLDKVWIARFDKNQCKLVNIAILSNGNASLSFGGTTRATRADESYMESAMETPYSSSDIASFIQNGKLLTEATADDFSAGGYFYVPAGTTYSLDKAIYAYSDNSSDDYISKIVIAGTLNIDKAQTIGGNKVEFIVADGGTIKVSADQSVSNGSRFVVLYGGTISGSGSITLANGNNQPNYLAGTLSINTLNVNGGKTFNCGTITSSNLVGNGATFTNEGKITVGVLGTSNFAIDLINNCYVEASTSAYINNLTLGDNAQLYSKGTLYTGASEWTLGKHALVQVDGNYYQKNTSITGPDVEDTDEYALLKIPTMNAYDDYDFEGWDHVTHGYIINSIFVEGPTAYNKLQYMINAIGGGSQKSGNGHTTLTTVNESPYYNPGGVDGCAKVKVVQTTTGSTITDTPYYVYYAFEDMGSIGDFDFNDIVLRASAADEAGYANIQLVAAGGELSASVLYNGSYIISDAHGSDGFNDSGIVNAQLWRAFNKNYPTKKVAMGSYALNELPLSIEVRNESGTSQTLASTVVTSATVTGEAPQCLIIPGGWAWPSEGFNITSAYPEIKNWVSTRGVSDDWWENVAEDAKDYVIYPQ